MPETNAHGQLVGDPVEDWQPRPWPPPVILEGRYVRVEPLTVDHADPLRHATCGPLDDDLWTYRQQERPTSIEAMADLVAGMLTHEGTESATSVFVPVEDEAVDLAAGLASYLRVDRANGSIELGGILLGRRLQRTRAATEALHLLIRHAFESLGYRRLEWKCDSLNEPSRRAAARLGLGYEGRFRNHLITKGRNRDTDWFALTDAAWPAVRAAHEQWLDPANFDDDGTQRTALSDLTADLRRPPTD